jgi:ABC-type transport system substrate-binding protein
MSTAAAPKILRIGLLNSVEGLDPREVQEHVSVLVMRQVFEAPYKSRKSGAAVEPLLFGGPLRVEQRNGGTRYRGSLREGACFSDGTLVTAQLVAEQLAKVESVRSLALVSAQGDDICFDLDAPTDRLESVLGLRWCSIVKEGGSHLLGTGPYAIAETSGDECTRLVRNVHYPQAPAIDEIRFHAFTPQQGGARALSEALAREEVHFTTVLSRDDVASLEGVRKLFRPGHSIALLYLNTQRPWLRNPDVRRAISMALDRRAIASLSYSHPAAFVARSVLPPAMTEYRTPMRADPRRARELLEVAGPPPSRPLRMLVIWAPRPYLPHPQRYASAIVEQLRPLGIEVETHQEPTATAHFRRLREGDYDLVLAGWMADSPDPGDFIEALVSSTMVPTLDKAAVVTANLGRWCDDETDRLVAAHRADPSEGALALILDRVCEQVPVIPLTYGTAAVVHAWTVRGFSPDAELEPDFSVLDIDERAPRASRPPPSSRGGRN